MPFFLAWGWRGDVVLSLNLISVQLKNSDCLSSARTNVCPWQSGLYIWIRIRLKENVPCSLISFFLKSSPGDDSWRGFLHSHSQSVPVHAHIIKSDHIRRLKGKKSNYFLTKRESDKLKSSWRKIKWYTRSNAVAGERPPTAKVVEGNETTPAKSGRKV